MSPKRAGSFWKGEAGLTRSGERNGQVGLLWV